MTSNTKLMLVLLEHTESDDAEESGVINTTGEPIRARPIRNVRPKAVEAFHPDSAFASLARWVGKAVGQ